MSTTPTERRLEITPGQAVVHHGNTVRAGEKLVAILEHRHTHLKQPNRPEPMEATANATLYADAHNTYNACDMLPSELLAKLREAVKTIADLEATCHQMAHTITTFDNPDPQ
jgi:hypothetical protein